MNNILVTGGAGYIGSHTVKVLQEKGFSVVVLDSLITGNLKSLGSDVKYYHGDIADRSFVLNIVKNENIEAVIHFAACSIVSDSMKHPDFYFTENVAKTNRFIASLLMGGVDKVVFSSTAATYGIPQTVPIPETALPQPLNPYGVSKLMIEQMLYWMELSYGLKWIALRYFNAAGAMLDGSIGEDHEVETHLIPLVLKTALGQRDAISIFGNDYDTPDGTCIRDYIHVLDLAEAHIAALNALEKNKKSVIYNVGTGDGYSVSEVIETARRITGKEIKTIVAPRRHGDPDQLIAKVDKIKTELEWTSCYSELETVIGSAWEWHRKHPKGFRG
ncbi:UDP-glucose 4-epimerase GalE [Dehalobacter sp.]|uniref:UDP-glucose 4-epimerase GalE n=1 Tax=Dehalobacter sp. TaxID=1962289 RepID=UPI002588F886|nr:UDP-glucose 4-epimerase GalE [Dehalobacter sp.]MDJ0304941.1 UDP-glucose 4-epimerase GalE [Dehalobacter sp.]